MKKWLYIIGGFWCIAFISCHTDTQDNAKTTLNIRLKSDPGKLNPTLNLVPEARLVYQYMYLPLGDFHPQTLELIPILIDEIPAPQPYNEDGVKYQVTFKTDAEWDDGEPITAEDYLFTLKFFTHPDINTSDYNNYVSEISRVEIDQSDKKAMTVYFDEEYLLSKEIVLALPVYPDIFMIHKIYYLLIHLLR